MKQIAAKAKDPFSVEVPAMTGNKEAKDAAEASKKALAALSVKIRDLPTKQAKLLALADAVEKGELALNQKIGFNMGPWYRSARENVYHGVRGYEDQTGHACGSVACLAGWAAIMDDPKMARSDGGGTIMVYAAEVMGFTETERSYFFGGEFSPNDLSEVSTAAAVAALRDYAKTGRLKRGRFKNDGTIKSRTPVQGA